MQAKENLIFIIVFFVLAIGAMVFVQMFMESKGYPSETIKDVISYVTVSILLLYLVLRTIMFRRMLRKIKNNRL